MTDHRFRVALLLACLAGLSLGGYLLASWVMFRPGFPLDDAWIHQTYARNLAERGEWAFLPGQPSAGSTAPLWSLLLVFGYYIRLGPYIWTFLLGWGLLWALAMVGADGFGVLLLDRHNLRVWAGVLLILEWHLVWSAGSGMETLLMGLLILVVLVWLVRLDSPETEGPPKGDWRKWFGIGGLIGLISWVRPDGLTLLGPLGWVLIMGKGTTKTKLRIAMLAGVGFALGFLPYLLFNQALAGEWWPNTFYAKQAEYAALQEAAFWRRYLEQARLLIVGVGVLLLPGFTWFTWQSVRRRAWGVLGGILWVIGYLGIYAWRLPVTYQHGRYIIPAVPVFILWGFTGLADLLHQESLIGKWRIVRPAVLMAVLAVVLAFWSLGARAYALDVAVIESEMVDTARWVAGNTDPESLIAAHDIGALGYFSKRSLLDLAGLISPEVIPYIRDEDAMAAYLDKQGADYLVTFPGWYPHLVNRATLIYTSSGRFSPLLNGENMAIYAWINP
ncbi:MAG: hypothetical protein A2Z45_00700 [Chloroflexi bacterium RBG_19FT_COMBO_55_16]|nr:MAG: hypothetical protein A2Z45_00700 [Chloroflexi bacterium RBG_19FT_COMBO_55_16]